MDAAIATIDDIHDEGRSPFIVMELVEGETLRVLASKGPMAPALLRALKSDWQAFRREFGSRG